MECLTVPLTSQDDQPSPHTERTGLAMSTAAHQDVVPSRSPARSPPEIDDVGETGRLAAETGIGYEPGGQGPGIRDGAWLPWQPAAPLKEGSSHLSLR